MKQKLKIKPAEGVKVRDPQTMRHIPDEGITVESSSYWLRKIQSGDVVQIEISEESDQSDSAEEMLAEINPKKKSVSVDGGAVPKDQINTRNK